MAAYFAQLAADANGARAVATVFVAGALWAGLYALLAAGGEAPSTVVLPIAPESYYLFEALIVVPGLFGLWLLATELALQMGRRLGGKANRAALRAALAPAQAVPLVVLLVIPETVAYLAAGFEGLSWTARICGALLMFAFPAVLTVAIRSAHELSTGRAVLVSLAIFVAQGIAAGPILR